MKLSLLNKSNMIYVRSYLKEHFEMKFSIPLKTISRKALIHVTSIGDRSPLEVGLQFKYRPCHLASDCIVFCIERTRGWEIHEHTT
ncbi:hypothetical protein TNIN_164981 [Trichonephila inaurata madagascariensis]|uniref:Uncharacterized protein n=1 Tax=Trichonephila inaurata madagascariensis TaxID=2747483 RepID=A0A8X6X5P3_9ARAC|nr:hypothetical protein TNIN_164981 [Trichonephila inaurata madagascariensis]